MSESDLRKSRRLWWAIALLLLAAFLAFLAVGANEPADPRLEGVAGFGVSAFAVNPAPGSALPSADRFCALVAENDRQRARGLMGRRDLGGYDAMLFRFDSDSTTPFYMRNVAVPLSIAWFDAQGRFVSSAEMQPCGNHDRCPLYSPAGPYRLALEVLQGDLDRLGVGEGARISVGGACAR